ALPTADGPDVDGLVRSSREQGLRATLARPPTDRLLRTGRQPHCQLAYQPSPHRPVGPKSGRPSHRASRLFQPPRDTRAAPPRGADLRRAAGSSEFRVLRTAASASLRHGHVATGPCAGTGPASGRSCRRSETSPPSRGELPATSKVGSGGFTVSSPSGWRRL